MAWERMRARSLLLGSLLVGCAARRNSPRRPAPPANAPVVRKISFEGNSGVFGGTNDYTLRGAMEQGQNESLTWLAPRRRRAYLDEEELRLDGWRIETWYAHHGYFNAQFLGWDVVEVRRKGLRPAAVKVIGRVAEGQQTLVKAPARSEEAALTWTGFDDLSARVSKPLLSQIRNRAALQAGGPFSIDALSSTESSTLAVMVENTFARATVRSEVDVYPAESAAQVRIVTEPGPSCQFGALELEGAFDIPREIILAEITFKEGDAYKASKLAETQQRLFSLGVFSVVNVSPLLEESDGPEVPIRVVLTERKPQQLQVGGGFLVESNKQDVHTSLNYRHVNLGNRLIRFDGEVTAGYTVIGQLDLSNLNDDADSYTVSDQGGVGGVEGTLSYPRAFGYRNLTTDLTVGAERVIEVNYSYFSPRISPSLSYRISSAMQAQLSYGLTLFNYSNYVATASDIAAGVVPVEGELYSLSELKQSLIVDTRDNPLSTRQGYYGIFELTEAGGPLQGRYNFLRGEIDQRFFWDLKELGDIRLGEDEFGNSRYLRQRIGWTPELVIAGRIGGGAIWEFGGDNDLPVPLQERLYLGGSSDMRGWSRNLLGPYVCSESGDINRFASGAGVLSLLQSEDTIGYGCSSANGYAGVNDTVVPIGGLYALNLSGELRRYFVDDTYGVALFADTGMVWLDLDELKEDWQRYVAARPDLGSGDRFLAPTVGLGLRYNTSIGPLRIDFGYRLNDDPRYRFEKQYRFHFALGETF